MHWQVFVMAIGFMIIGIMLGFACAYAWIRDIENTLQRWATAKEAMRRAHHGS